MVRTLPAIYQLQVEKLPDREVAMVEVWFKFELVRLIFKRMARTKMNVGPCRVRTRVNYSNDHSPRRRHAGSGRPRPGAVAIQWQCTNAVQTSFLLLLHSPSVSLHRTDVAGKLCNLRDITSNNISVVASCLLRPSPSGNNSGNHPLCLCAHFQSSMSSPGPSYPVDDRPSEAWIAIEPVPSDIPTGEYQYHCR